MYAVVQTGGKQYKVHPGDFLKVEKLDADVGSPVELGQVLALVDETGVKVGTPVIEDALVNATVVRTARHPKVVVFKKKRRKGYHKKQGHRQYYTLVKVDSIMQQRPAVIETDPPEQATTENA